MVASHYFYAFLSHEDIKIDLCKVGGLTADVHMKVVKKAYRGKGDPEVHKMTTLRGTTTFESGLTIFPSTPCVCGFEICGTLQSAVTKFLMKPDRFVSF